MIMPQMGISNQMGSEEGGLMMLKKVRRWRLRRLWGRGISWSCLYRRFLWGGGEFNSFGWEVMFDVLGAASGEGDEIIRSEENR